MVRPLNDHQTDLNGSGGGSAVVNGNNGQQTWALQFLPMSQSHPAMNGGPDGRIPSKSLLGPQSSIQMSSQPQPVTSSGGAAVAIPRNTPSPMVTVTPGKRTLKPKPVAPMPVAVTTPIGAPYPPGQPPTRLASSPVPVVKTEPLMVCICGQLID